jgi:threonyl-tRNA synthetase
MIHRAPFGSMERFMSILIEHTAGKFPLWLTPDQYVLLPVSDKYLDLCKSIQQELSTLDLRGFIDDRTESIGRKIRDNEMKKIPYLMIIGEKELESGGVSVRKQGEGDLGAMTIQAFAEHIHQQMED